MVWQVKLSSIPGDANKSHISPSKRNVQGHLKCGFLSPVGMLGGLVIVWRWWVDEDFHDVMTVKWTNSIMLLNKAYFSERCGGRQDRDVGSFDTASPRRYSMETL
jgi:hypothetical protein